MNEPIQEKTPKPPGLLPKHVQSWLILGLAVLDGRDHVAHGWEEAADRCKSKCTRGPHSRSTRSKRNEDCRLQNRIQELQSEQLAAQSALAQQNRLLGAAPQDQQPGASKRTRPAMRPANAPKTRFKTERKKREYLSLFASNIALSYRKAARALPNARPRPELKLEPHSCKPSARPSRCRTTRTAAEGAAPLATPQTAVTATQPNFVTSTQTQNPSSKVAEVNTESKGGNHTLPPRQVHVTRGGRENLHPLRRNRSRIRSHQPARRAVFRPRRMPALTNDIYSHDRQHLLIPAGTKILGETKKVDSFRSNPSCRCLPPAHHAGRIFPEPRPIQRTQPDRRCWPSRSSEQPLSTHFRRFPRHRRARGRCGGRNRQAHLPLPVPTSCARDSLRARRSPRRRSSTSFSTLCQP